MMTPHQKLVSIRRFAKAAVSMGELHVRQASEEVDKTGHSCYSEGWARGYEDAMRTMEKFILDTIDDSRYA